LRCGRARSGHPGFFGWPDPFDDYRQILVFPPPTHSRFLKFHVVVNEERVDFTIANPAFRDAFPGAELPIFKMPIVQKTGAEPRDECIAIEFPDPIRAPRSGGGFEIEYRLFNQLSAAVSVALDQTDHVATSFLDADWFTHKHERPAQIHPPPALRPSKAVKSAARPTFFRHAHAVP
jgi:hypothetical protein